MRERVDSGKGLTCLYVANIVLDLAVGYGRKVMGQAAAFRSCGIETDVVCLPHIREVSVFRRDDAPEAVGRVGIPALYRFSLLLAAYRELRRKPRDLVYFRYPRADIAYFALLAWMRLRVPRTRVYAEIPTYPYDSENRGFVSPGTAFWKAQDRAFRHLCKYLVHRFVAVSHSGPVFGRPSIRIENGVDPVFPPRGLADRRIACAVPHGIAVAHAKPWHGYDRVLSAMAACRAAGIDPPTLLVASPANAETTRLAAMARELRLNGLVEFAGALDGEALEAAYSRSDFAYGTLAPHRKGAKSLSTLKVRECLARGVPVVNAGDDPVDELAGRFVLKVPEGESPIDLGEVITWVRKLGAEPGAAEEMRALAEREFSWKSTMADAIRDMLGAARFAQKRTRRR